MDCLRCAKPAMKDNALCAECFAQGRIKPKAVSSPIKSEPPTRKVLSSTELKPFLVGLAFVTLLLIFTMGPKHPRSISPVKLQLASGNSFGTDPCLGKRRCLVAYVAPWCSACHASAGFIRQVGTQILRRRDAGFKLIVGASDAEQCREFANELNWNAFIDPESQFQGAVGFSSVPHWILLNEKQQVLDDFGGAFGGEVPSELISKFLRERLGKEAENLL